eukprot:5978886-Amphidinium_carterae.1
MSACEALQFWRRPSSGSLWAIAAYLGIVNGSAIIRYIRMLKQGGTIRTNDTLGPCFQKKTTVM